MASEEQALDLSVAQYFKDKFQERIDSLKEAEPTCCKCVNPIAMYCVECNSVFCSACCVRFHHPGTNDDDHSLEEIKEESDQSVKIITPLLEEILLFSVLYYVYTHTDIQRDYLYSGDVCMLTNNIKEGIAQLDDKAFYLIKTSLNSYCSIEDSYWRLFIDFWVRGIVTDSDSLFLIACSFLSAWIFKSTVVTLLVPVLALVYAIGFATLSKLEDLMPSSFRWLGFLRRVVKAFDVIDFKEATEECEGPPLTNRRARPAKNFIDLCWYEQNRIFRDFSHFFATTATVLETMFTKPIWLMVGIRTICIIFPLGAVLRKASELVSPALVATHSDWFSQTSNDEYTDRLLHFAVKHALKQVWSVTGFTAKTGISLSSHLQYALVPVAIYAGLKFRYSYATWKFTTRWNKGGLREQVCNDTGMETAKADLDRVISTKALGAPLK